MVCEVSEISRLDAQVLEGLCCGIDGLVEELAGDRVLAHGSVPQELVHQGCNRGHDLRRDVDVTSALQDFTLNELLDLCHLVLLGAVKLVCLTGSGVIVAHLLKSLADVNGVDGVEALLQVVGCEEV